ncbi:TonB-dependent receptor [Sphingomonas naphthae]|uniref:TonB-dependent receptor n=1 Tax=Sphingomonas naphthae TaxID=1813468 RepID=A0ABY7TMV4_9SPHN|nr:TonB-dependent receptor [Sphingomonas naphthae]WCT74557.1 TonB-dependent receptor [Sphingomonas naphthae]
MFAFRPRFAALPANTPPTGAKYWAVGCELRDLTRIAALLLLGVALPTVAHAQDTAEIVVTGRGLAASAGEAAYDVSTIGRDRLDQSASGRLETVLQSVAGFAQFRRSDSRSAHPTSQGATLRGLGGNASSRALVVLDGVPQVDPFGGWVNWQAFDPQRLSEVRVTRGGGSGANGPGALAGTIDISSAGPTELAPVWGGIAYGSRDAIDANAGISTTVGGGFASLSASYGRGDGFIPIVEARRGTADQPAAYRQGSVAARAVFPIGPDTELQANGVITRDARSRGLPFTGNTATGQDASVRLVGRGRWGWEALAYLQVREFQSSYGSLNAARSLATKTLDQYSVPATGIGGKIELRPPVGTGIELRLGADGRRTTGATKERYTFVAGLPTRGREAGGETSTFGGFVEATIFPVEALTLTAGGRIDRWRIADGYLNERTLATGAPLTALAFADRSGWEPTGRLGAAYKLDGGITLRAAGYRGWRLPTLNELYRPFRAGADATAANAGLKPETVTGVDGGIDWRPLPTVRLGATLFRNVLKDAIGNVTAGVGPGTFPIVGFVAAGGAYRVRQNLDSIRSQGIELEANGSWNRMFAAASFALSDAKVSASGVAAALDGLRPAQTPRTTASLTLGWNDPSALRLDATVRRVARQYEDDQNSRALAAATTLDATASYPLFAGLRLELRAENLTNTLVPATIAADGTIERATPRTLWVGLRFEHF